MEQQKEEKAGAFDLEDWAFVIKRKHQQWMDKATVYPTMRWGTLFFTLGLFFLRMYIQQGYAVVAYLLGLTYVNHLFLFLSPAEDPEDAEISEFTLPVSDQDEGKGFQRKLLEMELWKKLFYATSLALWCSLFECMDFEIYWQLLVFYFITVTIFLLRFKLEHMIKYKYNPFSSGGKKSYQKPVINAVDHF